MAFNYYDVINTERSIRNYVPSVQIKGFDISRLKINHFQTEKRRSGIITKLYTWYFFNSNTFPVLFHCIKGFQIGRKDNERSRNRTLTSSGLKFGHQITFRKLRKIKFHVTNATFLAWNKSYKNFLFRCQSYLKEDGGTHTSWPPSHHKWQKNVEKCRFSKKFTFRFWQKPRPFIIYW